MSANVQTLHAPKYYGFQPSEYKEFYSGLEKLEDIVSQIKKLHAEHYEETETLYKVRPLDPDYDRYIDLEQKGVFVLFTVRVAETGLLIGDLMYYLGQSMHNKGIILAREDAFFLTKAHRGGQLAKTFLKFAEACLLELGAGQIGMTDKSPCGGKSLKHLLEPLGYQPVAIQYVKEIGLEDE